VLRKRINDDLFSYKPTKGVPIRGDWNPHIPYRYKINYMTKFKKRKYILNGQEKFQFTLYVTEQTFQKYKNLADEMNISMSCLVEKLINNFHKFRDYDSK
jgi:hypothetical protein